MQRTLRGRAAFIGACCILVIGCSDEKTPIELVLAHDQFISEQFAHAVNSGVSYERAVGIAVERMKKVDLSKCPPDFAEEYYRHTRTWEGFHRAMQKQDDADVAEMGSVMVSLFRLSQGDASAGLDIIASGESGDPTEAAYEAIRTLWTEVEAAAIRHEADLDNLSRYYPKTARRVRLRHITIEEAKGDGRRWDFAILSQRAALPDPVVRVWIDGEPACITDESRFDRVYREFGDECSFLESVSSWIEVEVVDWDAGGHDYVGGWEGSVGEILGRPLSFGQVVDLTFVSK